MTGSAGDQMALLVAHRDYFRAERLAEMLPSCRDHLDRLFLADAADQQHDQLLRACLRCGFEPGGRHSHMTTIQFAQQRADRIRNTMPDHTREALK